MMSPKRTNIYPMGRSVNERAYELWLILQQTIQLYAPSITIDGVKEFESMFDVYWRACESLGMEIGKNHPIDVLEHD